VDISEKLYTHWRKAEMFKLGESAEALIEAPIVIQENHVGGNILLLQQEKNHSLYLHVNHDQFKLKEMEIVSFSQNIKQVLVDVGVLWVLDDKGLITAVEIKSGVKLSTAQLTKEEDENKGTLFNIKADFLSENEVIQYNDGEVTMPLSIPRLFLRESFRQY